MFLVLNLSPLFSLLFSFFFSTSVHCRPHFIYPHFVLIFFLLFLWFLFRLLLFSFLVSFCFSFLLFWGRFIRFLFPFVCFFFSFSLFFFFFFLKVYSFVCCLFGGNSRGGGGGGGKIGLSLGFFNLTCMKFSSIFFRFFFLFLFFFLSFFLVFVFVCSFLSFYISSFLFCLLGVSFFFFSFSFLGFCFPSTPPHPFFSLFFLVPLEVLFSLQADSFFSFYVFVSETQFQANLSLYDAVAIADIAGQALDIFLHGPESTHKNGILQTLTHTSIPIHPCTLPKQRAKPSVQQAWRLRLVLLSCPMWWWSTVRKLGRCYSGLLQRRRPSRLGQY